MAGKSEVLAVNEQKKAAAAVQADGFEGLSVLMKDLTLEVDKKLKLLIETDDEIATRALKGEIRGIKLLISRYVGYMRIET